MNVRAASTERGVMLPLLLAVFALLQTVGVARAVLTWQETVADGGPHLEYPLISAILGIGSLVGMVGVLLWRQWAIYELMATVAISVFVDLAFGDPTNSVMTRVSLAVGLAYFIHEKWEGFR